jgi:hypothetical protein
VKGSELLLEESEGDVLGFRQGSSGNQGIAAPSPPDGQLEHGSRGVFGLLRNLEHSLCPCEER